MTKSEFVNKLAKDVCETTKKYNKGSLNSAIIADGILKSNYGNKSRAKNANNIFAVEAEDNDENFFVTPGNSNDTKYKMYDSIEESVEDFVKSIEDIEITDALKKIINSHNLTSYDTNDEFIPSSKPEEENIKEESTEDTDYSTNDPQLDETKLEEKVQTKEEEEDFMKSLKSSKKNIIDSKEEPSEIDSFIIRKNNEVLPIYPNTLEEAKKLCDNHPGFSVANSKGTTLYTSPIPAPSVEIVQNRIYDKGRKFNVKAVAIYINPAIPTIYRTFTGTLALYDGVERNNRYRVCRPEDINNPRKIIGWIEKNNIV